MAVLRITRSPIECELYHVLTRCLTRSNEISWYIIVNILAIKKFACPGSVLNKIAMKHFLRMFINCGRKSRISFQVDEMYLYKKWPIT